MTDYSFLKTGFDLTKDNDPDPSLVKAYASIFLAFTEHGLRHAGKYTVCKNRKEVTIEDIKRGLKYEIFQFMERNDNLENIEKWKKIIDEENSEESDYDEDYSNDEECSDDDEYSDDEDNNEDLMDYSEDNENKCSESCEDCKCDKLFIKEMDEIDEKWEKWQPQNEIELSLMNRINELNNDNLGK